MADYSARPPTLIWALIGLDGRISREVYWLANIGSSLAAGFVIHPYIDENGLWNASNLALLPLVFAALVWVTLAVGVKRLHDLGVSGWLAGLLFIPLLNTIPLIAIGVMAGVRGPNLYGPGTNLRGAI